MIQTIKSYITKALIVAALLVPVMVPATAGAAPSINENLCDGATLEIGASGGCNEGEAQNKVNGLIALIINIFSIVVGVVAVVMIIIGGLKYITSSEDSNHVVSS